MSGLEPWHGGYDHAALYAMVHHGPGGPASADARDAWTRAGWTIRDIEAALSKAVSDIGAGWEGRGAEAATTALTPLGAWATAAAEHGQGVGSALAAQAEYAAHTRFSMPEPRHQGMSEQATGADMTPDGVIEHAARIAERDEAAARARDLMDAYTANSYDAYPGVLGSSPPPQVVVDGRIGATDGLGRPGAGGGGNGGGLSSIDAASLAPAGQAPVAAGGTPGPVGAGVSAPGAAGGPPAVSAGGAGGGGVGGGGFGPGAVGGTPGTVPGGGLGSASRGGALPGTGAPGGPATAGSRPPAPPAPRPGTAVPPGSPGGAGGRGAAPNAATTNATRPGAGGYGTGGYGAGSPRGGFDPGRADTRAGSWGTGSTTGGGYRPQVPAAPESAAPRGLTGTPGPGSGGTGGPGATSGASGAAAGTRGAAGAHPGMMPMTGGAGAGGEGRRRASYLIDDSGAFDVEPYHVPPVINGGDDAFWK